MNTKTTKNSSNKKAKDNIKLLIESIKSISNRYSTLEVFEDWLAMHSNLISNIVDNDDYYKHDYNLSLIYDKYNEKEIMRSFNCYQKFVDILNEEFCKHGNADVLGKVYSLLRNNNHSASTPYEVFEKECICKTHSKNDFNHELIKKLFFISLYDPRVGSGSNLIKFCKEVEEKGYSIQDDLFLWGTDENINKVYMTFLQLSVLGVPAKIVHGISLTGQKWSSWYTPAYVLGEWDEIVNHADVYDINSTINIPYNPNIIVKKIGEFNFKDGKVDITDPSYEKGVWCRAYANIIPGVYEAFVEIDELQEYIKALHIINKAMNDYEHITTDNYRYELCQIGVDTGMAGFFENKPDYSREERMKIWGQVYTRISYGIIDCGVWSGSGEGDGSYYVYGDIDHSSEKYYALAIDFSNEY